LIAAAVFSRVSFKTALHLSILTWVVFSFVLSGFMHSPAVGRREHCRCNLEHIARALRNYHGDYGCFPPAFVADDKGQPMHSWRVLILPYLKEQWMYSQYRFDEPWDGPNNCKLHTIRLEVYECPTQPFAGVPMTSYVAVVGPATIWPGATPAKFKDVTDSMSMTLMVVEMADSGIHWMEPRDLDASTVRLTGDPNNGRGICSRHRGDSLLWRKVYWVEAATVGGDSLLLPPKMPAEQLRALLTISGGEEIDWSDLEW
jgi:hypothetical protein